MKKMWKLNNKAVSPVIVTILMVAITVVLAAVLYVMVMGFGGGGADETPTGSLTYNNEGAGVYNVTISSISANDVLQSQVTWYVDGAVADTADIVWVGGALGTNPVISGSSIEVTFALASGAHTVALLYNDSNNNIATLTINVA